VRPSFRRPRTTPRPLSRARLRTLAEALGRGDVPLGDEHTDTSVAAVLERVVDLGDTSQVWLALAVLTAQLPDEITVVEVTRACEFNGAVALVEQVRRSADDAHRDRVVRVVQDAVIVDVAHTVSTPLTTGIQRVARETARRWVDEHDALPVSWTSEFEALRVLTPAERSLLLAGRAADHDLRVSAQGVQEVVVPWRATYLVPELAAEPARTARLRALARLSGNRTGAVGFDLVPITTAETTQTGFAAVFARNLAAVRDFDTVAAISSAAASEYEGWRAMLAATGVVGPRVVDVPLPVEAPEPSPEDLARARARLLVGGLPLVLVVGSHEPRKNHVAVLHAAELLWRDGLKFSLSFVGGNSWGSDAFRSRLADLQRSGRPVDSQSRFTDGELWASYRLARFTVFPSLNEGFGLPVAESLAVGTPVVTSAYGSMAQIAADGGALTVDPRDDHALSDAMRILLTDDERLAQLQRGALARPRRTWDDYAATAWSALVG